MARPGGGAFAEVCVCVSVILQHCLGVCVVCVEGAPLLCPAGSRTPRSLKFVSAWAGVLEEEGVGRLGLLLERGLVSRRKEACPGDTMCHHTSHTVLPRLSADVNECHVLAHLCPHGECINSIGSFRCHCQAGYTLDSTAISCIGEPSPIPSQAPASSSWPPLPWSLPTWYAHPEETRKPRAEIKLSWLLHPVWGHISALISSLFCTS
jgi:hypothetical protein